MKIIFLDIDGVLNSYQYDVSKDRSDGNIDKSRLPLLKRLIEETDAKIVLASSWRSHLDPKGINTDAIGKEIEDVFGEFGISVFDKTPEINNDRFKEISAWLKRYSKAEKFVIFDDIKFGWGELEPYVVKTDYRIGKGLEERHIEKAKEILAKAE